VQESRIFLEAASGSEPTPDIEITGNIAHPDRHWTITIATASNIVQNMHRRQK
jgi:hypothetical protein